MEIKFIENCDSTQDLLINAVKTKDFKAPFAILANSQNKGKGSRGNVWASQKGNLYLSFALEISSLPTDLPQSSASIYFAYIMKEYLALKGSEIWLKWPNDLYIKDKKIGGIITSKIGEFYICGIGINLNNPPKYAAKLDIDLDSFKLSNEYLEIFTNPPKWKNIFSKFMLEFEKSREFKVHAGEEICSLKDAILCSDGSVSIKGKKVYSNR